MTKPQIRLVSIGLESYAGISKSTQAEIVMPDKPVDITEDLKKLNPDEGIFILLPQTSRVLVAEGNQGTGKTSLINYLGEITGNFEAPANSVNRVDGQKKGRMRFYGRDGKLYEVRLTRATYVLEEIETAEPYGSPVLDEKNRENKKICPSPKQTILKVLGPAGFDPLILKTKTPAQQIEWLRSVAQLDTETLRKEAEDKKARQMVFEKRTEVNRDITRMKTMIATSPFSDLPQLDKKFSEDPYENLPEQIRDIEARYAQYEEDKVKLSDIVQSLSQLQYAHDNRVLEIQRLEEQLAKLRTEQSECAVRIEILSSEKITRYNELLEKQSIVEEYKGLRTLVEQANVYKNEKAAYISYLAQKVELAEKVKEAEHLSTRLAEYERRKKEFLRRITPSVEGIEICVPDEQDKREGIFYKGMSPLEWAESESWEVCSQLWQELGARIVFVENISSLGSGAIEKLNEFVRAGGYILGNQMNRTEDHLKITIQDKLPK